MYVGTSGTLSPAFFMNSFCFFSAFSSDFGFFILPNSCSYFCMTLFNTDNRLFACHGSSITTLCFSWKLGFLPLGSVLGVMHLKSSVTCVGVKFTVASCAKNGSPSFMFMLICSCAIKFTSKAGKRLNYINLPIFERFIYEYGILST